MAQIKKSEISRQRLLDKANQLFTEYGYQATGVDEISRAVGMTSGAFYTHFKSKLALLDQILEYKINNYQTTLFAVREKESAYQWVQRALRLYLSIEHRDSKSQSCPLTVFSTELAQIENHTSTSLLDYTKQFSEILDRRLLLISSENAAKAYPLMAMCMGAVQLARLEKNETRSAQILNDTFEAALKMIHVRGVLL